jgi:hypothetical protein
VFPFFYGADVTQAIEYLARWPDAIFLNLAWEQILMNVDIGVKTPRDKTVGERVYHICWTKKYRDFLSVRGVPLEHLLLTGNPTTKLYDLPYRTYFDGRIQLAKRHRLDPKRKWVLFPEAYQYAFMSERQLQSLVKTQNADSDLLNEARDYSNRSLEKLFSWLSELRTKTDPVFILRPRPSTHPARVAEFIRKTIGGAHRNIAVIKSESVREWILATDHVISSHSTTLIEAAMAGKPVHIFSSEPIPQSLAATWHGLVPHLTNKRIFLQELRRSPIEPNGSLLAAWGRAEFGENDSLEAIASSISRLHHGLESKDQKPPYNHRRASYARIAVEIAQKMRPHNRFDAFGIRDVNRRVSRWKRVVNDATAK